MKKLFQMMKPYDYILTLVALVLSFIPFFITHWQAGASEGQVPVAYVRIHGEIVDEFPLTDDAGPMEKTYYPNPGQYNIIEQDGNRIRVKEDNSPDQIAVKTSWISEPGQVSVCLPHDLMIEIRGQRSEDVEELILPHP